MVSACGLRHGLLPGQTGPITGTALQGAARRQDCSLAPECPPSEAGELILSALQQCIFGAHLQHVPFLKLVCSQSFEQVCVDLPFTGTGCDLLSCLPGCAGPLQASSCMLWNGLPWQARQAQRACGLLLEAAVSPANCFLLLQLGRRQGLQHLEARALGEALAGFSQAVRLDRAGFESLPEEVCARATSSSP